MQVDGAIINGHTRKKLPSGRRRLEILKVAEAQFASTGLHATTTAALARAAGISEAILYVHFGSKQGLFMKAVENNIATRLGALREQLSAMPRCSPVECIQSMVQITVTGCTSDDGNAALMAWALLEAREYTADLYRNELGAVKAMWEREMAERFPDSPVRTRLAVEVVPYAVNACMAFGFWLAVLRHTRSTAMASAEQYAASFGQVASEIARDTKEGGLCVDHSSPQGPG
jgi:AcrR family transcriptional regulator